MACSDSTNFQSNPYLFKGVYIEYAIIVHFFQLIKNIHYY